MILMEEAAGYLIAGIAILVVIALLIVYVILPLVGAIAAAGLVYGGWFATLNYAQAFKEVTVDGAAARPGGSSP